MIMQLPTTTAEAAVLRGTLKGEIVTITHIHGAEYTGRVYWIDRRSGVTIAVNGEHKTIRLSDIAMLSAKF